MHFVFVAYMPDICITSTDKTIRNNYQKQKTMKKLLLLIAAIGISILTFAQPSDGTIKAKILNGYKAGSSVRVEILGDGYSDTEYDDGAYHTYYRRNYKSYTATQYSGINHVYWGAIQYELIGGSYQFSQMLIGTTWYEGVPDPNKEEIIKLLNSDKKKLVTNLHYNKIVGEISDISIPDDVEYKWSELNHVGLTVNITFSEFTSYTELETAVHTYNIGLSSEEYQSPWLSFGSSHDNTHRDVISVKKCTDEEIASMRTLDIVDEENAVKEFLASLPEVEEPPIFQSDKQLYYYIHEIIMTKPIDEVQAHIYKLLQPEQCYQENNDILLKPWVEEWITELVENHEAYKAAHCLYPSVKAHQYGMITFYNRENKGTCRIKGWNIDETWQLTTIAFHPAPASSFERLKSNDSNCGEKPYLEVGSKKYEIGDRVEGEFPQGWYSGTISKKDPNDENRYYVKYDDGDQQWMKETKLKASKVAAPIRETTEETKKEEEKEETKTEEVTFKVGDRVTVNTSSGNKKGIITKYASHKYLVKFIDIRLGESWCSPKNLTKK